MARRRLLLGITCAAAFLAGCGGGTTTTTLSKSEYDAQLSAENQKVGQGTQALRLALETPTRTPAQVASTLESFADVLQGVGDDLAALEPPANAKSANQLLAKGFRDEATDTRQLADKASAAKSGAEAVALLNHAGTSAGAKEVDRALKQLHALGYSGQG
jgi:hypothetical protein